MKIYSAAEDLASRTLASISGMWRRLQYVARLRTEDGKYTHWGLERTHGAEPAQTALRHAHEQAFLDLLRSPLHQLLKGVDDSIDEDEQQASALIPANTRGGSALHFASVRHALQALRKQRRDEGKQDDH